MESQLDPNLVPPIFEGWYTYQNVLTEALKPLSAEQLSLRAAPNLRTIAQIVAHIIGARARWLYMMMGEGGDEFKALGRWGRRGSKARSAEELVSGLERTWESMQEAINRWNPEEWEATWPGEDDLHHGGEISITLGAHGIAGFAM